LTWALAFSFQHTPLDHGTSFDSEAFSFISHTTNHHHHFIPTPITTHNFQSNLTTPPSFYTPNSISSSFSMTMETIETLGSSLNGDFGFTANDRRFAFSRQPSFQQPRTPISTPSTDSALRKPFLSRTDSSIDIPSSGPNHHYWSCHDEKPSGSSKRFSFSSFVLSLFRSIRSGHRYMKRLFFMISLNVAYSTVELLIGLFTGRVGKM